MAAWWNMQNSLPIKIRNDVGCHTEHFEMQIAPDWIRTSASDLVGRCHTVIMTQHQKFRFIRLKSSNKHREQKA